jgi:hypothetical protein
MTRAHGPARQIAQPPPTEQDGPLDSLPAPARPAPPNPKVECCFSSSSLAQRGHAGVRPPTTSASNRCPHVLHWYSNKGMVWLLLVLIHGTGGW